MIARNALKSLSHLPGYISLAGIILLAAYIYLVPPKLAYVNTSKLLNEYRGMQDARASYQKKADVWKANIDTLTTEIHDDVMTLDKEVQGLSAKEKQLTEHLIQTKQKQLYDYQQALSSQAQEEDKKMTSAILEGINDYLRKYGRAKGYKIIMAVTEYGNIAYADEGLDITDEVLKGLNASYARK